MSLTHLTPSGELLEVTQEKGELEKEVEQLRKRVGGLPSATHRESGERGHIADKYADLKRDQMIASLVDLEVVSGLLSPMSEELTVHLV